MDHFKEELQDVDCDGSLVLTFKSEATYRDAIDDWEWVNFNERRTFVMIVNYGDCSPESGRQPWVVSAAAYDNANFKVHFTAVQTEWYDLDNPFEINWGAYTPASNSALAARWNPFDIIDDITSPNWNPKFDVNLAHSIPSTLWEKSTASGLSLSIGCDSCGTTGKLTVAGKLKGSLLKLKIEEAYIEATPSNLGAEFNPSFTVSGELSSEWKKSWEIVKVPLSTFSIPLIFSVGPELRLSAGFELSAVQGSATVKTGISAKIPDTASAKVDFHGGDTHVNGWKPVITTKPITLEAQVQGTLAIYTAVGVDIGMTIFKKIDMGVGLELQVPKVTMKLGAEFTPTPAPTPEPVPQTTTSEEPVTTEPSKPTTVEKPVTTEPSKPSSTEDPATTEPSKFSTATVPKSKSTTISSAGTASTSKVGTSTTNALPYSSTSTGTTISPITSGNATVSASTGSVTGITISKSSSAAGSASFSYTSTSIKPTSSSTVKTTSSITAATSKPTKPTYSNSTVTFTSPPGVYTPTPITDYFPGPSAVLETPGAGQPSSPEIANNPGSPNAPPINAGQGSKNTVQAEDTYIPGNLPGNAPSNTPGAANTPNNAEVVAANTPGNTPDNVYTPGVAEVNTANNVASNPSPAENYGPENGVPVATVTYYGPKPTTGITNAGVVSPAQPGPENTTPNTNPPVSAEPETSNSNPASSPESKPASGPPEFNPASPPYNPHPPPPPPPPATLTTPPTYPTLLPPHGKPPGNYNSSTNTFTSLPIYNLTSTASPPVPTTTLSYGRPVAVKGRLARFVGSAGAGYAMFG
ncbi:hypothetical protein M7I_5848 [Glarea lozoyensis 74030]|uniref:Uncharacterized protein n=1 Tax=Glarea lozoyensis (strain ATCC 74030 / MF5533) TaxID=1104152 RepID=H0ESX5_GLAL7|nr:hypothetical protein M7I_5848 [Glarea lozoyensis 74030]